MTTIGRVMDDIDATDFSDLCCAPTLAPNH
jgi:hypothetical protein